MRLVILFFFLINFSIAQKADLVSAIIAFQTAQSKKAKEYIDIVYYKYMSQENNLLKPKQISKFWYYRGQIYLQINEEDIAIESFLNAVLLNAQDGFQEKSINKLKMMGIDPATKLDQIKKSMEKEKLEF